MVGLAKPMLISGLMYTVASQFAGSKMGEKAVANLSQSLGKKVGRDVIAKRAMTTLTVVVAVGPDVVNCLVGRISFQQLIKTLQLLVLEWWLVVPWVQRFQLWVRLSEVRLEA